jgi:hypothetical protein
MAVAKRITPDSDEQITLNDGQVVNVTIQRGNYSQGDRESNEGLFDNLALADARLKELKRRAVEARNQKEYEQQEAEYKLFKGKIVKLMQGVDRFILSIIKKWDMALSEEDEKLRVFVPLTMQGLATLDEVIRMDVFTKTIELLAKGKDKEKKDSSASLDDDSVIQMENSEQSHTFSPVILSPSDTGNDPNPSSDGQSMNLTKPS